MSQFNDQDFDRLMDVMGKFAPSMDAYIRTQQAATKNQQTLLSKLNVKAKKIDDSIANSIERFGQVAQSATSFATHLNDLARKSAVFAAGATTLTALFIAGTKLNETWREMTEVGQTFGGSMFAMQQAANNAGLPLEVFANLQRNHNHIINATGQTYWAVNKQLRENTRVSGMYGMSMEQLGDFTAQYMDVFRRNGSLQSQTTGEVATNMQDLALTTTALAKASDKTRTEITKLATTAMNSALAFGGLSQIPLSIKGAATKSVAEATAAFAALPGTAGEYFSRFFTDSMGIQSNLTEGGQLAIDAGMSDLATQMDAMSRKFKAGQGSIDDQINMQNKFIDAVQGNIGNLTIQAGTGNAAARQMLDMVSDMKKTSRAEFERAKEQAKKTEAITAFMASVEEIFSAIKASFGKGFIDGFKSAFSGFEQLGREGTIKKITAFMEKFGSRLGTLIGTALTETNMRALAKGIEDVVAGMFSLFSAIALSQPLWSMLGTLLSVLTTSIGAVVTAFDSIGANGRELIGKFAAGAVLMIGAMKMIGGIRSLIGKMLGNSMVVNARSVVVNGGPGGADVGGAGGKGKGKFGRLGRLGGLGVGLLGAGLGYGGEMAADKLSENGYNKTATGMGVASRALAYGATGAMLGSFLPGAGTMIGGALGAGYGALSGYMDYSSRGNDPAAATNKAAEATKAAAASIAATNEALKEQAAPAMDGDASPMVDPMQTLIDEIKQLRGVMQRGTAITNGKLDTAIRLLNKIEVSAQSL